MAKTNGDIGCPRVRIFNILAMALSWHLLVQQALGALFRKIVCDVTKKNLTRKEILNFHSYFCSMVHAAVIAIIAVVLFFEFKNWTEEQKLFGYHDLGVLSTEMFIAYMLQDTLYLLYYFSELRDLESLVHHISYLLITVYTLPNCYFLFAYSWLAMGEASTPFLGIRWILAVLDLKHTTLYKINGVVFTLLFFITRIVVFGFGLTYIYSSMPLWWPIVGLRLVSGCLVCLYGLNIYWFIKIFKGILRIVKEKDTKST